MVVHCDHGETLSVVKDNPEFHEAACQYGCRLWWVARGKRKGWHFKGQPMPVLRSGRAQ